MRHGVLGTGMVGETIATKLVQLGHEVRMGSRTKGNDKAVAWTKSAGTNASEGTFADCAMFGDILWNCTAGVASLSALESSTRDALEGKVLIDVANPLDNATRSLTVINDDSLGERIQRAFPGLKVVKTLNTMNCNVMVDPARVGHESTVFMSGDYPDAKKAVREILESFGWKDILDLGGIQTARGVEAYLLLWLRLWGATKSGDINVKVQRPS